MLKSKDNLNLNVDEQRVLSYWRKGDSMTDAYKKVMLTPDAAESISKAALSRRVIRFFGTYRMRMAMAATPGKRGEKAKKEFAEWERKLKSDTIEELGVECKRKKPKRKKKSETKDDKDENKDVDKEVKETPVIDAKESKSHPELNIESTINIEVKSGVENDSSNQKKSSGKSDKDEWLESLNVNKNPSSMTVYGTGQFIAYMAVKEIMARQAEIKLNNISVLDKNGSVFTPTIISALKTAAAMILPYAPAPTPEDRREMTKAAVLLGLMPESITESPDDYTAPMPNTIEVTQDE